MPGLNTTSWPVEAEANIDLPLSAVESLSEEDVDGLLTGDA